MANKSPKSQKLEIEALQKKHEVELQKLREKHLQANKPRAIKPMRKKQGR